MQWNLLCTLGMSTVLTEISNLHLSICPFFCPAPPSHGDCCYGWKGFSSSLFSSVCQHGFFSNFGEWFGNTGQNSTERTVTCVWALALCEKKNRLSEVIGWCLWPRGGFLCDPIWTLFLYSKVIWTMERPQPPFSINEPCSEWLGRGVQRIGTSGLVVGPLEHCSTGWLRRSSQWSWQSVQLWLSRGSVAPACAKVMAVRQFPQPTTKKELKKSQVVLWGSLEGWGVILVSAENVLLWKRHLLTCWRVQASQLEPAWTSRWIHIGRMPEAV